jgi:hypothetical protein
MPPKDLFDNVYELVDSLTFKSRSISPNMWRVFELTYELFRTDAIDFLDGNEFSFISAVTRTDLKSHRDASFARQFRFVRH